MGGEIPYAMGERQDTYLTEAKVNLLYCSLVSHLHYCIPAPSLLSSSSRSLCVNFFKLPKALVCFPGPPVLLTLSFPFETYYDPVTPSDDILNTSF